MITILHGEDTVKSRNAIPQDSIVLDAKSVTDEYLAQLTSGGSLFEEKKVIVIENPKILPLHISGDLLLWFDHKLTPGQLKGFPNATLQEFKISEVVFNFVESLQPKNLKKMISLFRIYCQQEQIEIIFTMITRQFRLMINPNELSSWQKDRVVAQSKFFTPEILNRSYKKLLKIDFENKNGLSVLSLIDSLELFLLTL